MERDLIEAILTLSALRRWGKNWWDGTIALLFAPYVNLQE